MNTTTPCQHIEHVSAKGLDLIKSFEGWSAKPYLDSVRIPTIGYGNTYYENGVRVKMTDPAISLGRGEALLRMILTRFEKDVDAMTTDSVTQAQFDALVCMCYNIGQANLRSSTLLKKVNKNPNDPTIRAEFAKWNRAGGKVLAGLTRRRKAEADLYFS